MLWTRDLHHLWLYKSLHVDPYEYSSSAPSVVAFRSTSGRPAGTHSIFRKKTFFKQTNKPTQILHICTQFKCQCKRNTNELQASGQSITPRSERLTESSFGFPPVDASWWLGGLSLQDTRSGTRTFHCRGLCNATARCHICVWPRLDQ